MAKAMKDIGMPKAADNLADAVLSVIESRT